MLICEVSTWLRRPMWKQILANVCGIFSGSTKVGIHDSFFDLGGDLCPPCACSLHSSLFHTDLPPNTLFHGPNDDNLAAYVTALTAKENQPRPGRIDDLIVPLQTGVVRGPRSS